MSTDNDQMEMGTNPVKEHEWLKQLDGAWKIENEMSMGPGEEMMTSTGTATTENLGGLWSHTVAQETMPNGKASTSHFMLGYDVSFKEYRGSWISSVSSHLWKYVGELSADGKTMTLNCEGPSMIVDGETALYRDTIELIDENTRVHTSHGQDENGDWQVFMKATYTRA